MLNGIKAVVHSTGEVTLSVPFVYSVPHKYELKEFPFDKHEIFFRIGCWS